jgi:hypothetical protein
VWQRSKGLLAWLKMLIVADVLRKTGPRKRNASRYMDAE